jgi:hypothetical protein
MFFMILNNYSQWYLENQLISKSSIDRWSVGYSAIDTISKSMGEDLGVHGLEDTEGGQAIVDYIFLRLGDDHPETDENILFMKAVSRILTTYQIREVASAMDLSVEQVEDILNRAAKL